MLLNSSFNRGLVFPAMLGIGLLSGATLQAATFQSDFNNGIPPEISLLGAAANYDHSTGGKTGGALKILDRTGSQTSSAIISDFNEGAVIGGFDATFQLYIGSGTGADGIAFCFGDFADATWGEEGPTIKGLTVVFDVYNSGGTPAEAPAIDVKWDGAFVYHRLVGAVAANSPASPIGSMTTIRTQTTVDGAPVYVPVKIHVDTDGTLDIVYNNVVVVTNLPIYRPMVEPPVYAPNWRFGIGGRTGGSADNFWIDDLVITTSPVDSKSGQPFIATINPVPVGANAGAAGGVSVSFSNSTYAIIPGTVKLNYTNTTVTPIITEANGVTRIAYNGVNGVLPVGGSTVTLSYATTGQFTNSFSYVFVVDAFSTVNTNAGIVNVDTSKPGFKARIHQFNWVRTPGDNRGRPLLAERQLAGGYVDITTGLPFDNWADLSLTNNDGYFAVPGVINFSTAAPAAAGNFNVNSTPPREDQQFPGMPGAIGTTDQFVFEVDTILELKAGGHRFAVNSDDGFRVVSGQAWDVTGTQLSVFDGTRGAADTTFDIVVAQDGFYPVRIVMWNAGSPGSMEFVWFDPDTGSRVLVNDPDNLKAPRAYYSSPSMRPYVSRVLPVSGYVGAFPNDDLVVDITEDVIPVNSGSVTLQINNVQQAITTAKSGKVTTVTRKSSIENLLPSGLNTVRVIYSYNAGGNPVTYTNTYSYTVAPYYGILPPGNRVTGVADFGFKGTVDQIDKSSDTNQANGARINGGGDSNRMPWPEVQLAGGNINPTNGQRYPNLAQPGPNSNFTFEFDFVNWSVGSAGTVAAAGVFQSAQPASPMPGAHADEMYPGMPGAGTSAGATYKGLENFVIEIKTYLELKRGVYVFGVNGDDGFIAISGPNVNDTLGTLLGFYNGGRGQSGNPTATAPVGQNPPQITPNVSSGSTLFSVIVVEDGIYPVRVLYVQGGTGNACEFYTLNKDNGMALLVGDTAADPSAVTAYKNYNGPARPYVKMSVSPTPWDNAYQQVGPGPINMIGRTRGAVNSSDIYNLQNTAYYVRPWADVAIGGVIGNGTSEGDLRLLLNGVQVPAMKTTNGTDVTISYKPTQPLPPGSTNTASLVYAGTTNSWSFTVQPYQTLNAADALPLTAGDASTRGFKVKMTLGTTNNTAATVARAEAQIAGQFGTDLGTFIQTNIINWSNLGYTNTPSPVTTPIGNFQVNTYGAALGWPFPFYTDEPLPGIEKNISTHYAAAEVFAYVSFPAAGYYRLGVNSDDGFAVKIGTPGVTNGQSLINLDLGKGSSDVPFSFVVPQAGIYPLRFVWFNGTGGAALELFSYDELGNKIPLNDWNNPKSIKTYHALAAKPTITNAYLANGNIVVTWANGGTLESAPTADGPWTSTGDTDGNFSEPTAGIAKFFRVR